MTTATLSKPRTRVTWTAEERTEWLALFEKSGKTAAEFCRDNDLSQATLSFWRQQQDGEPSVEVAQLVQVPAAVVSSERSESVAALMIHFPSGMQMQVVVGTDAAWLSTILRTMTG